VDGALRLKLVRMQRPQNVQILEKTNFAQILVLIFHPIVLIVPPIKIVDGVMVLVLKEYQEVLLIAIVVIGNIILVQQMILVLIMLIVLLVSIVATNVVGVKMAFLLDVWILIKEQVVKDNGNHSNVQLMSLLVPLWNLVRNVLIIHLENVFGVVEKEIVEEPLKWVPRVIILVVVKT